MQIGIDSFAAVISEPATGLTFSPVDRIHHLPEEIEFADRSATGKPEVMSWSVGLVPIIGVYVQ